ncbi:MAG: adenylate/guanylate cyclase domain-containing protein [Reyranellaceae bacterium]
MPAQPPVFRREWEWHFDVPPALIWPVLADTARFNEAASGPTYSLEEIARPDGSVERRARGRIAGMDMAWEELPYEWIEGLEFRQTREFTKGPFRKFGPRLRIEPDGAGSKVTYALEAEPATLLGRLLGNVALSKTGEIIERLAREAARYVRGERNEVFDYTAPEPPDGARQRVDAAVAMLEAGPYAHGLARRLGDYVLTAQQVDVGRIRPLALARAWNAPPRHVIELCLAAVRAGLLGMRWDLLCTSCRGGKLSVATLDQLPTGAHCPSCNIDYERNFARNVELVFFPNAAIRPIGGGGFCLSGPMTTPHVVVQQIVEPNEVRALDVDLPAGSYRARALVGVAAVDIDHKGGDFPTVVATENGFALEAPASPGRVNFANRRAEQTVMLLESREWVADALTAHRATMLQAFRDLFAQAALRPGDEAGVDRVCLMFSDLKGSTELYERLGDAAAYNLVREHFAYLGAIVRDHNGAVVKTIGDAVMAAFGDPADALRAAVDIQRRIGEFNAAHRASGGAAEAIVVKLGIHRGPCIVVNLNERLDYFGSTVNLAARLEGESRGADVVLSTEVAEDPQVARLLGDLPHHEDSATLRGFGREVPFRRVTLDPA